MRIVRTLLATAILATATGCASGLNSYQKSELEHFQANGIAVEEKNPGLGAALGLLPGGGSFYGRAYGYGVVNLLFWPLSILWDPVSGYDASQAINYQATKAQAARQQDQAMNDLDERLTSKQIDLTQYTLEKRKIDRKYRFN